MHDVGGMLLMFCGAFVVALLARSRVVLFGALATAASIVIWMNAPFTGVFGESRAFDIGTGDATRYLLPGAAVAALTLALASRRGGWLRWLSGLLLGAAAVIGLRQTFALGYPNVPAATTPLAGLALGAAAAALTRLARRRLGAEPRGGAAGTAAGEGAARVAAGE